MTADFVPPKPETKQRGNLTLHTLRRWLANGIGAVSVKAYRMKMGEIRLPMRRLYYPNDPPLIRRILVDEADRFPKSEINFHMLRLLMGDSIFSSNGATWRRQRRLMDPAFEAARIKEVFGQMRAAADALAARLAVLPDGARVEFDVEATHVTADIILRTIFTEPIAKADAEQIYRAFNRFQEIAYTQGMLRVLRLPAWLVPGAWAARRAARQIRGLLDPLIRGRLDRIAAGGDAGRDILGFMIAARDPEDGSAFTFDELAEQICMLFLAGHETSASALGWSLYLIAMQPAVQARLQAEAEAVLGDRPAEFSDMRRLEFTRDVFREALRLYPPVAYFAREPTETVCLRDKTVKPGSILFISPWMLHRNIRLWQRPDVFDPDRFRSPEGAEAARCAYLPFSQGPRVCLGASFAQQEGVLILATVMRRFTVAPVPGHVPEPVARLTLRSGNGMPLILHHRPPLGPEKA